MSVRARALSDRTLTALQLAVIPLLALAMHFHAGRLALVPALAVLILATSEDRGLIGRWLAGSGLLRKTGDLSYSIYMLHVPVISLGYLGWPRLAAALPVTLQAELFAPACTLVTIGLAALVWRWFEMPLRSALRPKR